MADIGHEVPPGRLQSDCIRFIGRVDNGEPVAQRPDLAKHRGGLPTGSGTPIQRGEIDLDHLADGAHPRGRLSRAIVRTRPADQAQFDGGGVGQHHVTRPVQQHHAIMRGKHNPLDQIGGGRPVWE